jgi:hypothetical protein
MEKASSSETLGSKSFRNVSTYQPKKKKKHGLNQTNWLKLLIRIQEKSDSNFGPDIY